MGKVDKFYFGFSRWYSVYGKNSRFSSAQGYRNLADLYIIGVRTVGILPYGECFPKSVFPLGLARFRFTAAVGMRKINMIRLGKNLLSKRDRTTRGISAKKRSLRMESLELRNLLAVSPFGAESLPAIGADVVCQLDGSAAFDPDAFETETAAIPVVSGASPVDLDGDGFIGSGDYALLTSRWLTTADDSDWDPRCDIDGDGFVGASDFSYISINWFKSVDDPDFVNPPVAAPLSVSVSPDDPTGDAVSEEPEVLITLAAVSEPTEDVRVLRTGTRNFGTFYYLPNDEVPVSTRQTVIENDQFYLELWVSDLSGNGEFISSIQIQLDYDPDKVISLEIEDIYAGKYTLSEFLYYDTRQSCLKAVQVGWLFSATQDWSLLSPITGGENSWLLARFTVTIDSSLDMTPSIAVTGVTQPVSPFVAGYYYVRTGESYPLDDNLIKSIGVPAFSRFWTHSPDIDGNGVVSTGDWGLLLGAWNTLPGDDAWNEDCDINGDGYIDGNDLVWLVDYWTQSL